MSRTSHRKIRSSREIRRQAERARSGRHLTFWQGLGLVGAVGWMVSLPAGARGLAGPLARCAVLPRASSGRLSLLVVGLALGCASAWRHVQRELNG